RREEELDAVIERDSRAPLLPLRHVRGDLRDLLRRHVGMRRRRLPYGLLLRVAVPLHASLELHRHLPEALGVGGWAPLPTLVHALIDEDPVHDDIQVRVEVSVAPEL